MSSLTGIKHYQKSFAVTTSAQDCLSASKNPRDILLQNNHATATVYVDLSASAGFSLSYTSGGTTEIEVGDTITGATSAATGVVLSITLASGTWAGGTAAGVIRIHTKTGTFQSENLNVGASLNLATISADSDIRGLIVIAPGGGTLQINDIRNAISVVGSAANTLLTVSEGRT
jgi:hypothetical protein